MDNVLIKVQDLKKHFPFSEGMQKKYVKAIDGVSLEILRGETLGLVGESGCGKSTLGRVILRLQDKTEGNIFFEDKEVFELNKRELLRCRRDMQIIFQDPYACLNPRLTIGEIIAEPLKFHGVKSREEQQRRVREVVESVSLPLDILKRYPHELSGGQQQRVGIARALILKPKFIVCDEAVSALDVSVQAQILNLLVKLKEEYQLTYLFISHNLAVVHHLCDRIAVMYLGKIVEIADKETLFQNPLHPYTKALMAAVLSVEEKDEIESFTLMSDLPNPIDPPCGCRFHPRCEKACDKCSKTEPQLVEVEPGHFVSCYL